ncbi:MAG: 2-succinyl-6-hydroxy-2,4-cyclohexadiene-1-carboxylate synthase, partial [Haemophilus parainfluenzae]|nr:2-succinyl-6-hydroxy-2,4-cyclohexadiene-1-carboxylate synthase [Haemophilus parainfluenzae]
LGGRIAQYYALQARVKIGHLKAVILEGANLGLQSEQEKQSRLVNDNTWAERFFHENPETVLEDWYKQPVFSHLNEPQRKALIEKRKANCGPNIGRMLLATSLAKQPDFREKVRSSLLSFFYFCGERDQKFRQMAEDNQLDLTIIPDAGHNAHLENPTYFAEKIENIVLKIAQP